MYGLDPFFLFLETLEAPQTFFFRLSGFNVVLTNSHPAYVNKKKKHDRTISAMD